MNERMNEVEYRMNKMKFESMYSNIMSLVVDQCSDEVHDRTIEDLNDGSTNGTVQILNMLKGFIEVVIENVEDGMCIHGMELNTEECDDCKLVEKVFTIKK